MIHAFRLIPLSLVLAVLVSGCAEAPIDDGPVVKTAKACQRAKEKHPDVIKGFKINACTNTGVWMVDQYDEQGTLLKRFDFVNREYSGPESQGIFMPVDMMGADAPQRLNTIRQTLNDKLLHPPES